MANDDNMLILLTTFNILICELAIFIKSLLLFSISLFNKNNFLIYNVIKVTDNIKSIIWDNMVNIINIMDDLLECNTSTINIDDNTNIIHKI